MRIKLLHIIIVVIVMTIMHVLAVIFDLYEKTVWIVDGPLHFAGGVVLGMFWLWLLQTLYRNTSESLSLFLVAVSITGFALFGSFVWELFEFSFWKLLPEYATNFKLYSSSSTDLISDLGFGFIGGTVVSFIYYFNSRN